MPDIFGSLMSPEVRADPYPYYAQYRVAHPLADTGLEIWFVFGYADCLTLLRERRVSVDERHRPIPGSGDELPTLIHLDPPVHDRLRRLVQAAFTPRRVETLRQSAVRLVDETLARFHPGDEIDLVDELAYPMPLTIICDLLGVEPDDRDQIRSWSTLLARSIDPDVFRSPELNVRIAGAQTEFVEYIRATVGRRRRAARGTAGDDLLSQLVALEMDGDRLNENELVGLAVLLLVAGHETTVSLISNGMLALLRHPAQLADAARPDVDARTLVDELLRYDSPVQMTSRITLEDIELPSGTVPKAKIAVLMLGAANHDPVAFTHPERLDVSAHRDTAHLAFGSGIHHCLGAVLARAEAEAAIPALARRFPSMVLLDDPLLRPTFVLRGRESLRVRL